MAINTNPRGPDVRRMYGLLLLGGTVTEGVEIVSDDDEMLGMALVLVVAVTVGMLEYLAKVINENDAVPVILRIGRCEYA